MEQLIQKYFKTCGGSRPPLASNRATDEGRLWIEKSALLARHAYRANFKESPSISTLTAKSKYKQNKIN
jgi:hypothetical protein